MTNLLRVVAMAAILAPASAKLRAAREDMASGGRFRRDYDRCPRAWQYGYENERLRLAALRGRRAAEGRP